MKIGILTQPLGLNYGGLLQNYALQTVLTRMGHSVATIAPVKAPLHRRVFAVSKSLFRRHLLRQKKPSEQNYAGSSPKVIGKNMYQFIAENISMTNPALTAYGMENVRHMGFDAYVVGSDQVWRPRYSPYLPAFFLIFAKQNTNIRKLAYAASFGVDTWELSPKQTCMAKEMLTLFDGISVREDSAIKLCEEHLGAQALHVLDPTMLLSQADYSALIDAHSTTPCNGDLFTYVLDRSEKKQAIINKVSTDLGLKMFEILPTAGEIYPSVYQWLRSFRDAKFVITDSFHGTVFSILFDKPFISVANEFRGKSRFVSLLKIFGLKHALVHGVEDIHHGLYAKKDAEEIEATLEQWRQKSLTFLKTALAEQSQ